jgi:Mg2+ and Co2+ transporter CorA
MNVRYPGIHTTWGWIVSLIVIVACSYGLYLLFRHKDWL